MTPQPNPPSVKPAGNRPRESTVAVIPEWACGEGDFASVVTAIHLADLEGKWFRLSAANQRQLFGGKAPLGKKAVKSDGSKLEIFKSQCFGMDFDIYTITQETYEKFRTGFYNF